MISRLAEMAADVVLQGPGVGEEDKALYVYGFFMLLSHVFYLILAAIFGLIFGVFVESLLFYVLFSLVRGYAGGVHAATEQQCTWLTSIALFISVALIKLCTALALGSIFAALSVPAALCVIYLSPLDSAEKRLTAEEGAEYKKKSVFISALIFLACLVSFVLNFGSICAACSVSLCLEAVLLCAGKLKEREERR